MMPIDNGIGWGKATSIKYRHLIEFYEKWTQIAKGVKRRNDWIEGPIHYFDLHAGNGKGNVGFGSPNIFLHYALQRQLEFEAYLFEIDKKNSDDLKANLGDLWDERTEIIWGDHEHTFWPVVNRMYYRKKNVLGLAFYDPTGTAINFDFIKQICLMFRTVDILIYMSATNHKRFLNASHVKKVCYPLDECILSLPKKHWLIRDSYDRHRWIYLFGCNWPKYPPLENIGFFALHSVEGQKILEGVL